MSWFLKYKLHHIFFWLIYFAFWTYFSMQNYETHFWKAVLATSIYFAGQAGIGYFSIYYLVPRFFFTKRYPAFAVSVLTGILLGSLFITGGMFALFHSTFSQGAGHIR